MLKQNFDITRARAAFSKKPTDQNSAFAAYYPFHKLPDNKSATLRFIPDANPDNELGFLIERRTHELLIDGKNTRVACLETYGKKCPICELSRSYYKAKDTVNGKKYWHKKDYLAKAIVVKDGLPPNEDGEVQTGKVVILALGKVLYDIIAHNISSGDLGDDLPCHIENGFDFIITRTTKPGPNGEKWGDYTLSKFARQPRALEQEELALLEFEDENGSTPNYIDLSTMLAKEPEVSYVEGLLEQSLGGGDADEGEAPPPVRTPARTQHSEPTSKPATPAKPKTEAPAGADDDEAEAQAFLAQIRSRRAAAKASSNDDDIPY